jgi:hypothetical protein
LHDGDYLKHWEEDDTIKPKDLDRPVRYIIWNAAPVYCRVQGKQPPSLNHYRAASKRSEGKMTVTSDTSYQPPDFAFMSEEWTDTTWDSERKQGKDRPVPYQYGSSQNDIPSSTAYTPGREKTYTGRALGFRCVEN